MLLCPINPATALIATRHNQPTCKRMPVAMPRAIIDLGISFPLLDPIFVLCYAPYRFWSVCKAIVYSGI
jgi:hypothetical protein